MTPNLLFAGLYRFFSARRWALFLGTLALLGVSAVLFRSAHIEEDVAALLPDDNSESAVDFRLLQDAPFARKVLIELRGDPGVPTDTVIDAADAVSSALSPDLFRRASGEMGGRAPGFMAWVNRALPDLATEEDLTTLGSELAPDTVKRRLRETYATLLSPEGWALKGFLRTDPLSMRDIVFQKLRYLALIPKMRMQRGNFVSEDGRSVLLVTDTPVPVTDSAGAGRLVANFSDATKRALPRGIKASLLCGHRYTLANAETIQRDLHVVLGLSFASILAIYLVYLRSRWSVFVFLVPASILVIASGVLAACHRSVFAATLGFGGVLLGIADEYANYIYFALRRGGRPVAEIVGDASRPVLFGGLATLGSLAVMFLSSLPGQRQLALYAMTGIGASLLLSLVVLPHLIPAAKDEAFRPLGVRSLPEVRRRPWLLAVWALFLLLCGSQLGRLHFNGDIRALSLVPDDLKAAEESFSARWGDVRGKALAFASGPDLETALQANERLFALLRSRVPEGELVSLAPILPSERTRRQNRERWARFWSEGRRKGLQAALSKEAKALGFAPDAFTPFFESLATPSAGRGAPDLESAGLGDATRSMILRSADGVRVLTLIPDTPEVLALLDGPGKPSGVHVVSQTRFAERISRAVGRDFFRYLTVTSVLVTLLVVLAFRDLRKVLLTLVPVLTGLLGTFGGMALFGIDFNLFNVVATVLIIGICVDYGIYMVCRTAERADHGGDRAVLVSGLTTLAGLGVLILAHHPAMHSLGVTVLMGVGVAIPSALFIIPALWARADR